MILSVNQTTIRPEIMPLLDLVGGAPTGKQSANARTDKHEERQDGDAADYDVAIIRLLSALTQRCACPQAWPSCGKLPCRGTGGDVTVAPVAIYVAAVAAWCRRFRV